MKNFFFGLFIPFMGLSACSTDFQLEGEWKDIPVVYGFVSIQDSAHYIRVQRAFLEPGGNANEIAQIPDSLYYNNITVEFIRENGDTYQLSRIDGNLEGYPREDGSFATSPNYLYKIRANEINLQGGELLTLRINRGDDLEPVTAETRLIGEITMSETSPSTPLNLEYTRFINTVWQVSLDAQIFDIKYIFNYKESLVDDPTTLVNKSVTWDFSNELRRDPSSSSVSVFARPQGISFYQFLGGAIEEDPSVNRIFDGMDIQVTASGQEIVDLINIARANSGITSSQVVPVYSNISEGIGFFSSRSVGKRTNLTLNFSSQDSLENGIYTRNLNF